MNVKLHAAEAHLVGSLPAPDAETAMRTALDRLGTRMRAQPDGPVCEDATVVTVGVCRCTGWDPTRRGTGWEILRRLLAGELDTRRSVVLGDET